MSGFIHLGPREPLDIAMKLLSTHPDNVRYSHEIALIGCVFIWRGFIALDIGEFSGSITMSVCSSP